MEDATEQMEYMLRNLYPDEQGTYKQIVEALIAINRKDLISGMV